MTKAEMIEDELEYLNSLPVIFPNDDTYAELMGTRNYIRIPKFFKTHGEMTKIELSLNEELIREKKEIIFADDKGKLVAFIPDNGKPAIKSPSDVFFEAFDL